MCEIIRCEIEKARKYFANYKHCTISEDRAYSHVILKYFFDVDYDDQLDLVTDGSNDGGIDFVYYNDEDTKVVVCQSKCTENLDFNSIIAELDKMCSTVTNFFKGNTGSYNDRLKLILQNSLDRLPDESVGNVEYNIFTTADVDVEAALRKINITSHAFSPDDITIHTEDDIEKKIQSAQEALQAISSDKIRIDYAKNVLHYESNVFSGIMVNALSTSIVALYNKYAGKGLFDLNIRKYIKNTMVDSGIKRTLDDDRGDFWFLNNGIIIACNSFDVDGNTVKLYDFSIVNGGQTTTLIGTYKGKNKEEFFIPCKIVEQKNKNHNIGFFTKIAEATNSQKPIYARDLKSTAPEMLRLARWLDDEDVYLEIKRGVKPKRKYKYSIKNDELAQLILSMVEQRPGTSRSGKKVIFERNDIYNRIFRVNYDKDPAKKGFLLDLIDLYDRYHEIEKEYKHNGSLDELQTEILKNGKQIIFAILGVIYRLANNDILESDLNKDPKMIKTIPFTYGRFISNYSFDDLDKKLQKLIQAIIQIVSESYIIAYQNKLVTSVSNYFKTDVRYYDSILRSFVEYLPLTKGEEIKAQMNIFKR